MQCECLGWDLNPGSVLGPWRLAQPFPDEETEVCVGVEWPVQGPLAREAELDLISTPLIQLLLFSGGPCACPPSLLSPWAP